MIGLRLTQILWIDYNLIWTWFKRLNANFYIFLKKKANFIVNQLGNQETNYDNNNMKTNPRGNLRLENDYKR